MRLTEKCKEDFEKWYENPLIEHIGLRRLPQWFYTLTYSMQYGVYVDFFDSVGIAIGITLHDVSASESVGIRYDYFVYDKGKTNGSNELLGYYSRKDARSESIAKANEIYNEKSNS